MSVSNNKKTLKEELAGKSLDEQIEFFDTHDMGEYWDEMPEVQIEVIQSPKSRKYRDKKNLQEVKDKLDKAS